MKDMRPSWSMKSWAIFESHPLYAEWVEALTPFEESCISIVKGDNYYQLRHEGGGGSSTSSGATLEECEANRPGWVDAYTDFYVKFWLEKYVKLWDGKGSPIGQFVIVNGRCYCPEAIMDSSVKGFGGSEFNFYDFEGNHILSCRNNWTQGDVPDVLRKWFPDTATFDKKEVAA